MATTLLRTALAGANRRPVVSSSSISISIVHRGSLSSSLTRRSYSSSLVVPPASASSLLKSSNSSSQPPRRAITTSPIAQIESSAPVQAEGDYATTREDVVIDYPHVEERDPEDCE